MESVARVMRGDRVFRIHSPQVRLGLLKNRTMLAVWLLILAGVLTAANPVRSVDEGVKPFTVGTWAYDQVFRREEARR